MLVGAKNCTKLLSITQNWSHFRLLLDTVMTLNMIWSWFYSFYILPPKGSKGQHGDMVQQPEKMKFASVFTIWCKPTVQMGLDVVQGDEEKQTRGWGSMCLHHHSCSPSPLCFGDTWNHIVMGKNSKASWWGIYVSAGFQFVLRIQFLRILWIFFTNVFLFGISRICWSQFAALCRWR